MLMKFYKCSRFIQMFMTKNAKSYNRKKKKKETEKENKKTIKTDKKINKN